METAVSENLARIRAGIAEAARQSGRDPASITLVAVSKNQSPERIDSALAAGQRVFGENKVQEATEHWGARKPDLPDLRLHLIGPLQTNKVRAAHALFDVIETLDRPSLAEALGAQERRTGRKLSHLIQVNTGEEPQKHGILPSDLPSFLEVCRKDAGLDVRGLMCVPPIEEPPALHFAFLAELARRHGLKELSMGMSADYGKAIPLGATFVRVGTGIFGARRENQP